MSQTVIAQLCSGATHQGFSNFFVLWPILKVVFLCDPLTDSRFVDAVMLDDDRVNVPLTNRKAHFCLWRNHKNAHNPRRQWRSQPKILGGAKNFWGSKVLDFWRLTLFCLEKRLSRHKMTIFSKNFEGMALLPPPCLRLFTNVTTR